MAGRDWDEANSVEAVVIDDDGRVYENISIASEAVNPNVSYNKDKFLITWSDKDNKEIHGAYYSISSENEPEINNEKFVISAVSEEAYMSDVFLQLISMDVPKCYVYGIPVLFMRIMENFMLVPMICMQA